MSPPSTLQLHDRTVDLARGEVDVHGVEPVILTTKELQLLTYLARRPGQTVSREELLEEVWGYVRAAQTRAVDNMMRKLRVKVEADPTDPRHLLTVFGEGYRFAPLPSETVATSGAAGNLVPPLHPVLGRDALIDALHERLTEGARCLVLYGPPGIGKTTLARALALHEQEVRVAEAWSCSVDGLSDAGALQRAVATALGATEQGLDHALRRGRLLLVLDGAEQLDDGAEAKLERWLGSRPELDVVATARQRVLPRIGVAVEVPPLPPADARRLLERLAHRVRPQTPTAALTPLADRLEGWPLALELAAARLRVLTPTQLLERLDQGRSVLGDPGRGQALERMLGQAIDALAPPDADTLVGCAVFRRPFDAADIEVICGEDRLDSLHRLLDQGLLRTLDGGRLSLLDPIRDAAARHGSDEARQRARRAHIAHLADLGAATQRAPVTPALERLAARLDDADAALEAALPSDPDAAARIAVGVARLLRERGHLTRLLELLRRVRRAGPSPESGLPLRRLELVAGLAVGRQVDDEEVLTLVADAQHLRAPAQVAAALLTRAQFLRRWGRIAEGEAVARRVIDTIPDDGPAPLLPHALLVHGGLLMDLGRSEEAQEVLERGVAHARRVDDRGAEAQLHYTRGMVEIVVRRDPVQAERYLSQAIATSPQHDPRIHMDARLMLAQAAVARGDLEATRQLCTELSPQVTRFGEPERLAVLDSLRADVCAADGDWDEAERLLRAQLDTYRRRQSSFTHYVEGNLGILYRLAGRLRQAVQTMQRARATAEEVGAVQIVDKLTPELAAAWAELGEVERAEAELASHTQADLPEAQLARAHLSVARGELDEARRTLDALAAQSVRSLGLRTALRHLARTLAAAPR